jgi:hypothetical protein
MATAARGPFRFTSERLFYAGYGLFVILMVALGFGPSWAARAKASGPPLGLTPLILVHGLVFLAWVLLFVTQASLISARQHVWHKRLGFTSLALVVAMLLLGVTVAATQEARGTVPPFTDALSWLAVPLFDLAAFAGLVIAGVLNRHRAQYHKRFMLMATLVFLYASVGRFTILPPTLLGGEWTTMLAALLMLPLVVWDLKRDGRIHPATLAGLAALFGEQLLRLLLWHTDAWHAVARGIIGALG